MITLFSSILLTPNKGWETVKNTSPSKKDVLMKFATPMLAILCISAIAGTFIEAGSLDIATALKRMVVLTISVFMGMYISAACIKSVYKMLFKESHPFTDILIFTIYSYACVVAVLVLDQLFEDMFFIDVFYLYTIYPVYEGCNRYLQPSADKQDRKTAFIVIASAVIIACPIILRRIMLLAMPGLN